MTQRFGFGLAAALVGGFAYGLNAPFATIASQIGVPGPDVVMWRAALMLFICLIAAHVSRTAFFVPPSSRGPLLLLGAATTLTSVAYLSAVAFVPVAVAAIVFYTFPIVILILSPLVDGERITVPRALVFAAAFLGVAMVVGPGLSTMDPRGLILAMAASAGAATMMFVGTRVMSGVPAVTAAVWVHVIVLPATFGVALIVGGPVAPPLTDTFLVAFAVIGGSYVLGFWFQLVALRHIPAVVAGLAFLIEPVIAIITAALVLGERLTATQYMGCAAVLVALVASALVERRELERRKTMS